MALEQNYESAAVIITCIDYVSCPQRYKSSKVNMGPSSQGLQMNNRFFLSTTLTWHGVHIRPQNPHLINDDME